MRYTNGWTRTLLGAAAAMALVSLFPAIAAAQGSAAPYADAVTDAVPPAAWLQQDPADSLYKVGREALSRGRYREAVEQFRRIRSEYPRSGYAADAYYWEAFALDRIGTRDNLRQALEVLELQHARYEDAATLRDAEVLATRIRGKLASMGDAEAAERVAAEAYRASGVSVGAAGARGTMPAEYRGARGVGVGVQEGVHGRSEDQELKMAALQALMMMDKERAVPLLMDLLQQGDAVPPEMRAQAVMVLAQHGGDEAHEVLLNVIRNDPDSDVRGMALMMMAQAGNDRALDAIEAILQSSDDPDLQHHAIIALSQQKSPRAQEMLRGVAERGELDDETRLMAIMMMGQSPSPENQAFLRELYATTDSPEVKERIIHSLAMNKRPENQRWLLDIALDNTESAEVREQALFMAAQTGAIPAEDLIRLYDETTNEELRNHLLFALSQHKDPAAVDKLIDIARNDPNPEMRQRVILWLAQSKDPRVADLLEEIIRR